MISDYQTRKDKSSSYWISRRVNHECITRFSQ
jgi:hypothetical protein